MAGNFNVSGIVKLVDDFSAKARTIAAATDHMSQRMTAFQQKAASLKSTLVGLGAAIAGAFTFNKLKDALHEAATEQVGIRRFEHMFEMMKDVIGVGKHELEQEINRLGKLSAIDPDLLMAETSERLMKGARLTGKNFLRAIQLSTNIAAGEGANSEAATTAAFSKVAGMLINPRQAMRKAQAEGIINPEDLKKFQQLAKHSKNIAHLQGLVLDAMEKRHGGRAKGMMFSPSFTDSMIKMSHKEMMSGIGTLINPLISKKVFEITSAIIEFADGMTKLGKELEKISDTGQRWKKFTEVLGSSSPVIKILAGALAFIGGVLAVFALKAALAMAPMLIMLAVFGVAAWLVYDFSGAIDELTAGFSNLDSGGKVLAATVGIVSAAFVAWKVGSIIASLASLAVATWSAAGPWILWAAAILIVAGLIYIFRDSISAAFSGLGDVISNVWTGMKDGAQVAIDYIVNIYTSAVGKLKELFLGLKNIFLGIGDSISAAGSWVGGKLGITQGPSTLPAAGAKASVEGQVNINIKDPGNNASISSSSNGNIPVNVGQTRGGSYRSTVPSSMVPGPR